MSQRRPPRRAGSGDNHEARLAIIEQRFPEALQARCSWCGRVHAARQGLWIEVLLSAPGAGVTSTHVFRCLACEVTDSTHSPSGVVAIPRQARGTPELPGKDTELGEQAEKEVKPPALPAVLAPGPKPLGPR
ncbi:MAG: hypothetical protein ACRDIF_05880 [Actinomycetota bacterium]